MAYGLKESSCHPLKVSDIHKQYKSIKKSMHTKYRFSIWLLKKKNTWSNIIPFPHNFSYNNTYMCYDLLIIGFMHKLWLLRVVYLVCSLFRNEVLTMRLTLPPAFFFLDQIYSVKILSREQMFIWKQLSSFKCHFPMCIVFMQPE